MAETELRNRLQYETSPYLKQHETNPVDWYPWGDEALRRAHSENKPILLSVGYSACHWCHVMAHESFENGAVAALLNQNFICIKVDREERPDLDQIYQNVAQAMTGGGGWPLTVFLTPDLRPFYGGTYFPPEDKYGRPGFSRLIRALSEAFKNDRKTVDENAEKLTTVLHELESVGEKGLTRVLSPDSLGPELRSAAEKLLEGVDWQNGGLGGAPKFPNTGIFTFLWRVGKGLPVEADLRDSCLAAVILTLTKMAEGGIFDQIGGGFHRYSVDAHWSVPHFEKMLYDNALLLQLYCEVLATDSIQEILNPETRSLFKDTVFKTIDYLLREMRSPKGEFYAAQDADSEGEEGKFFVWNPEELRSNLTPDEAHVFSLRYGVDESGNFEHGSTVLYQAKSVKEVSASVGKSENEVLELITAASKKLMRAREKRIRPGLDDKTLVAWCSLLVSALAFAAVTLDSDSRSQACREAALIAFERIQELARDADGKLLATIQKGKGRWTAYLDDHAFLGRAALDLSRAFPERASEFQKASAESLRIIREEFKDDSQPGYFFVGISHEKLLTRPKSIYDQAIPSGTAVTLGLLITHLEITENSDDLEKLRRELKFQADGLFPLALSNPYGHGELLCAALSEHRGVVLLTGKVKSLLGQPEVLPKAVVTDELLWCSRGSCRKISQENLNAEYSKFLEA